MESLASHAEKNSSTGEERLIFVGKVFNWGNKKKHAFSSYVRAPEKQRMNESFFFRVKIFLTWVWQCESYSPVCVRKRDCRLSKSSWTGSQSEPGSKYFLRSPLRLLISSGRRLSKLKIKPMSSYVEGHGQELGPFPTGKVYFPTRPFEWLPSIPLMVDINFKFRINSW